MSILLRGSTFGAIAGVCSYFYIANNLYKRAADQISDINKLRYTINEDAKPQEKYIEPKAEWNYTISPVTPAPATRTIFETYNDFVRSIYKKLGNYAY